VLVEKDRDQLLEGKEVVLHHRTVVVENESQINHKMKTRLLAMMMIIQHVCEHQDSFLTLKASASKAPKTIFGLFWEYVDQHFGFINPRRLDLLREQSEDDEALKIPPLGRQTDDVR
jgi:hypothetical protein